MTMLAGLTLDGALGRLAGQAVLAAFSSGPSQAAWCLWGGTPQGLCHLDELPPLLARAHSAWQHQADGWPHVRADALPPAVFQADYEFPVGPWSLFAAPSVAPTAQWWQPNAALCWLPDQDAPLLLAVNAAARAAAACDLAAAPQQFAAPRLATPLHSAWDAAGHRARVDDCLDRIARGDCYQLNLALAFSAALKPNAHADLAAFSALIANSPASYAGMLRLGTGRSIVCHSPELFLRLDGEHVESAPIKGTRPRQPGSDDQRRAELAASAKERAELAMIVDLVRNDLGRVAAPGSVRVVDPGSVVDLTYVHHRVGRVQARLPRGRGSLTAVLAAAFPAGSISGAPKISAMRAIAQLEAASGPRGAYCGTLGLVAGPQQAVLAVAIRTGQINGSDLRLHAGGGIVADSQADSEWAEVHHKLAAWRQALGVTGVAGVER